MYTAQQHGDMVMATRTVQAKYHTDGHIELLEKLDLPENSTVTVILQFPDKLGPKRTKPTLPVRHLGPMRTVPSRDELYDDLI